MKIRYYGHVGQVSGYGIAASDLCMALSRHPDVDLQIVPLQPEVAVTGRFLPLASHLRRREDPGLSEPDVIIVHTLPRDCRRVLELEKLWWAGGRSKATLVAQTTWEAQGQAPIVDELAMFDQVWAPSTVSLCSLYNAAIEADSAVPKRRLIPHCFDEAAWEERRRVALTLEQRGRNDGRFCFYYVGANSGRKNLAGLLRAWAYAFRPDRQDVLLRIVAPGGRPQQAAMFAQTGLNVNEMAPIQWTSGVSEPALEDLHWVQGDCFVTATRGEAWNLPAFEAMLAGRNVISPGYLGSDQFLRDTTAALYAGHIGPAAVDVNVNVPSAKDTAGGVSIRVVAAQGLSARCVWREPDLMTLASLMNQAANERQRTIQLRYNPAERYGYTAVANLVVDTLTQGT